MLFRRRGGENFFLTGNYIRLYTSPFSVVFFCEKPSSRKGPASSMPVPRPRVSIRRRIRSAEPPRSIGTAIWSAVCCETASPQINGILASCRTNGATRTFRIRSCSAHPTSGSETGKRAGYGIKATPRLFIGRPAHSILSDCSYRPEFPKYLYARRGAVASSKT